MRGAAVIGDGDGEPAGKRQRVERRGRDLGRDAPVLQWKERFGQRRRELPGPAALIGAEQQHRAPPGALLRVGEREEALARPALVDAAGARGDADIDRPRRQRQHRRLVPGRPRGEAEARPRRRAAGDGDEVEELVDEAGRALVSPGRALVREQEARRAGDEAPRPDPAQDEAGEHAALRVDDEIEAAPGQRPAQQLAGVRADAGVLDDLVEQRRHQRRQRMGVDGLALAREPGDARLRPALAERAEEGELHHPVAQQLEAGIDQQIHGARHCHRGAAEASAGRIRAANSSEAASAVASATAGAAPIELSLIESGP